MPHTGPQRVGIRTYNIKRIRHLVSVIGTEFVCSKVLVAERNFLQWSRLAVAGSEQGRTLHKNVPMGKNEVASQNNMEQSVL